MNPINEIMVETYYQLIKSGRRDRVPDTAPVEVQQAVATRLAADKGASDSEDTMD